MAIHLGYYDDWKSTVLECPKCHWKGTFEQGSVDYFDALKDSSCPTCDTMLAIVSYPTIQESESNWSKLTDTEKLEVEVIKQFRARWEAACLKSPDQLPDLDGPELTFAWDCVAEGTRMATVIRLGDVEIWREPSIYEGYRRFDEIVMILKQKYGARLADVVPTQASELDLYGDKLGAPYHVSATRQSLKEGRRPPEKA